MMVKLTMSRIRCAGRPDSGIDVTADSSQTPCGFYGTNCAHVSTRPPSPPRVSPDLMSRFYSSRRTEIVFTLEMYDVFHTKRIKSIKIFALITSVSVVDILYIIT